MNLQGAVVVVTGGAGGIGERLARKFLQKGASVCVLDVLEDEGRCLEKSLRDCYGDKRFLFLKTDITNRSEFEKAFDIAASELGPVRVLCNNAGIHDDLNHPENMVAVNLTGVIFGTLVAIERMRKDRGGPGGVIINTASMAGLYPYWIFPAYSGTKAGVLQFTRAYSLSPHQQEMAVRFNVLCPSTVRTERQNDMSDKMEDVRNLHALNESEGWITPEDVANLVCRLIEEDLNGVVATISKNEGVIFHDLPVKKLF